MMRLYKVATDKSVLEMVIDHEKKEKRREEMKHAVMSLKKNS